MSGKKYYQFTEDQKFQLITAWGILHDSSHVDYFNRRKRTSALKTIAETLASSINEEDEENSAEISIAKVKT